MTQLGINGLAPGFKYDVRVRGIFNGQPGEWSPTYEIDVFSDTSAGTGDKAPAAVTDLTITPTIDSFIITWTAPIYNADGTILNDMKDYVLEVSDVTFGTADATYLIPEHNKPADLSAVDRQHQFEFTYKMNKELYGTATPTLYVRIYARDTTNNRSGPDTATATNAAPSAPGTPSLTPFGGGIAASWTAGGADTVEYVLRAHTASMANPPVTGTEVYRGKVLNFSHVTTGTKYYRVGAVDIFGQTTWSNEASATALAAGADTTPPAAPTGLADVWQSTSYILTWTPPADLDVVRYQIDIRNNGNTVTKTFYSEGPRFELTMEDNIQAFGGVVYEPHYVRVWAIDAAGNISATYAELDAAATDPAPNNLAAPTLATPVIDAGGIYISWPKVTDTGNIFDSYELYGTGTGSTTVIYAGDATFFRYALPSAYSGTYYFRARTKDKFGRYSTSYSTEVSVTATSTLTAPTSSVAGSLDPADPSNRTGILTVSSISGPSSPILAGYKLRYKKAADSNWTEIDVNKSATTYIIKNVPPGVSHNVEMASYDVMGRVSGTWTASTGSPVTVTADTTAPSAPTSVALASGATSLNVTFTGVTATDVINNLGRYEVEIATDSGFTTGNLKQTQPGGTASQNHLASFTGLTPATTYWARVRAIDANGNQSSWAASTPTSLAVGSSGNPSDGNVPTGTIPTPTAINGIGGIHVRWTAMSNNDPLTYEVHIGTAAGFSPGAGTLVGEVSGTYFFCKVDGSGSALAYSTNYYFKLRPKDVDGPHASYGTASGAGQVVKVDGGSDVVALSITSGSIAADAIIADKIDAGAIDTTHINATGIDANRINIGGNASNMVPSEWADFEFTSTMYDSGGALRPAFVGTPTLVQTSATQVKFGSRAMAVTVDAASEGIYFNTSATTYNIPVLSGKTYIVSAYVRSTVTGTATLRYKPSGGSDTALSNSVTATTANTWVRVYGTFTAGSDTTVNLSIIFSATSGVQYIDGVMMEERVGTQNVPSGFVKPGTTIDGAQIVTGSVNADRITAGSITTGNFTSGTIDGAIISAGTISAGKLTVTSGVNLVNPAYSSFELTTPEEEISPYDTGGSAEITAISGTPTWITGTTQARHGVQSLEVTTQAAISDQIIQFGIPNIPVVANTRYLISAYVYQATGGSRTVTLRGIGNVSAAADVVSGVTSAATGTFTRVWGIWTAGASDTLASIQIKISNHAASANVYYIDAVQFEEILSTTGTPSGPSTYSYPAATIIDGASIASGSITGEQISAGTITADMISAGALATHQLGAVNSLIQNLILGADANGQRVEADGDGLRVIDANGNLLVDLPTDSSKRPKFNGDLIAQNLEVIGASILGETTVGQGTSVALESVQAPPGSAPSVSIGYPSTVTLGGTGAPQEEWFSLSYNANGTAALNTPCFYTTRPNSSGYWNIVEEYIASNGAPSRTLTISSTLDIWGIATIGSQLYMLYKNTNTGTYALAKYNLSNMGFVSTTNVTSNITSNKPGLGTDGTDLYIVCGASHTGTANLRTLRYNTSLSLLNNVTHNTLVVDTLETGGGHSTEFGGIIKIGTDWYIAMYSYDGAFYVRRQVYKFTGTITTSNGLSVSSDGNFFGSLGAEADGIAYDGASIYTVLADTGLTKHTDWTWTSGDSSIYWVGFTWRDGTGTTHETTIGPRTKLTARKRAGLNVTATTIPSGGVDDPDSLRIYINRGATEPQASGRFDGRLQGTYTQTTNLITSFNTGGAQNPATNDFPGGTPAKIESAVLVPPTQGSVASVGWSMGGDGTMQGIHPDIQIFEYTGTQGVGGTVGNAANVTDAQTTHTWHKPTKAGYTEVEIFVVGGGGGGGGGGRNGGANNTRGGGGGGGGSAIKVTLPIGAMSTSETVRVGGGGGGGGGRSANNAGADGGNGGYSSVSVGGSNDYIKAGGGNGGTGGDQGAGGSGGGVNGGTAWQHNGGWGGGGGAGLASSAEDGGNCPNVPSGSQLVRAGAAAGGGGGGWNTTAFVGGSGGNIFGTGGGAAGTITGVDASNGTSYGTSNGANSIPLVGAGGGGGGGRSNNNASDGGDGGLYGAGGGGGGGAANGSSAVSGNGGAGARGIVVITCR